MESCIWKGNLFYKRKWEERTYVLGKFTSKPRSANGKRRHKLIKIPSGGSDVQKQE